MTTFNTGAYPAGCTQRDVDMAQPGYWDEPDDERSENEILHEEAWNAWVDLMTDIENAEPGWAWHEPIVSFWDPATGEVWRCPVPTPPILF
jgi:hypothetical protein